MKNIDRGPLGMTNGAAWYSLRGTLQDYGYIGRGIMDRVSQTFLIKIQFKTASDTQKMEVTLEMGCEKTVHSQQTMAIYGQNKQSLFDFLEWFELIRLKFQPSKTKIVSA